MVRVTLEHIATTIPVKVETESLETLNDTLIVEGYLEADETYGEQFEVLTWEN
jgi:tRNA isopentenyl-2-thiomethyl-A-37 hydroxylase MiaE